jgi:hypothetical protein
VIEATIQQRTVVNTPDPELRHAPPVRCFRHEGENCLRCDGSGHRLLRRCDGCGAPAGRPSQGGKALLGLRNRRGRDQPFYCLGCHPELGRRIAVPEGVDD